MRRATVLVAVTFCLAMPSASARQASTGFTFARPFWVNLHHFLYVLGRAEAKMPDAARRAVAGAAKDQETGLASLTPAEQQTWRGVVAEYASGLSQKDAVFDASFVAITRALVRAGDARSLGQSGLDAPIAAALERAAPIYRKAWWPAHDRANQARQAELQTLLAQYERQVLAFVTRAYQERWPDGGYPVNLSGYANWAGAYSTDDRLLVLSSLDTALNGAYGLEIVVHEAMHQWDDAIAKRLEAAAARRKITSVPPPLSHALVFYTAGEAVRAAIPAHVPYAEANGNWRLGSFAALKPALDAVWKPYLQGTGTLDRALAEILAR